LVFQGKVTVDMRTPSGECCRGRDLATLTVEVNPVEDSTVIKRDVLKNVRVLVLEDESDTRTLLDLVLKMHGAEVILAENVREALQLADERQPDVIVTDIGMPDLNGFAFIASFRGHSNTPAIALTAYDAPADRDIALTSGFNEYLSKPFDTAELVDTIKRLYDSQSNRAA
jgi:DNA-binding response OmpR family regulator